MHILIIPSWYPEYSSDVVGSFFREQAIALAKHKRKVGVIYPQMGALLHPKTWSGVFRKDDVTNDEGVLTYRGFGMNWIPRVPYASAEPWIRKGMRLFRTYVRDNGWPDVLHAHSMFNGGLLACRISEKYGIPFVVTEHSSAFARGLVKRWQLNAGAATTKKASACLAVSIEFAQLLDRCFELPRNTWAYVPNMVSDRFANAHLRTRRATKDTSFIFCNIAFLKKNKGVDLLLRAFHKAFSAQPEVKLVIGGDGEERNNLEKLSQELGLSKQVDFLGSLDREQVADVMSSCDAFVLASHFETFGVVVIEALALGKPVVATRCGGPESIVQSGDGLLVEKGSVEALANGMLTLRQQASAYKAAVLREDCLARFGEESVVNRLLQIYEDALVDRKAANV